MRATTLMLSATTQSTVGAIGIMMHTLVTQSRWQAALRAGRVSVADFVREVLRWEPPLHLVLRFANGRMQLGGQNVPSGSAIQVNLAAANRDPDVFLLPDIFDPTRQSRDDLSFGRGVHTCPGSRMATAELELTLQGFLDATDWIEAESVQPIAGREEELMNYEKIRHQLEGAANEAGFVQSSEALVGCLLRLLVAIRPGGRYLELGTGMGVGLTWLLSALGADGEIVTVELKAEEQAVARGELGGDDRITWVVGDGSVWLRDAVVELEATFDGVFADTWPGKYHDRDLAMRLVKPGGWYVVDDLYPQPGWPEGHQASVDRLVADLTALEAWTTELLEVGSGIIVCVRGEVPKTGEQVMPGSL